jgi:hypothetical protein
VAAVDFWKLTMAADSATDYSSIVATVFFSLLSVSEISLEIDDSMRVVLPSLVVGPRWHRACFCLRRNRWAHDVAVVGGWHGSQAAFLPSPLICLLHDRAVMPQCNQWCGVMVLAWDVFWNMMQQMQHSMQQTKQQTVAACASFAGFTAFA